MHHLLVVGMGLSGCGKDPGLDFLGDYVLHNGFQVWFLQAEVRKDETLICGIQLPQNCGLWTQRVQVPLFDGKEGSLGCIGESMVYIVARISHLIPVSQEDCGHLARRVE